MQTDAFKDKQRERILEIRKQQIEKKLHTKENVNVIRYSKKPFPKLVFIIIIFCIFGFYAINNIAWGHMESIDGTYKVDVYRDVGEGSTQIMQSFYSEANAVNTGILEDYFYTCPVYSTYGLLGIFIISISLLLFGFIDKKKDFSIIDYNIGKFVLNSLILIPTIYLMVSVTRFFGSYLVMANTFVNPQRMYELYPWMEQGLHWSYPTPYILLMGGFVIILIIFTEMDGGLRKILHELDREYTKNKPKSTKQKISYQ